MTPPARSPLPIPRHLAEQSRAGGAQRISWLDRLAATVADLTDRWGLRLGDPFEPGGGCAWVAPGTDRLGRDVVIKVAWVHTESRHEAEGLAAIGGEAAATVYAFEHLAPDTTAMLLQRCRPGTELRGRTEAEQHRVITALLRRVRAVPLPAGHPFRPLTEMADEWADQAERTAAQSAATLDPGLARYGLELLRDLPRTAGQEVLLCTDLHAGNVLSAHGSRGASATQAPWVIIDPKPYVGDPHYDVLQHLINCEAAVRTRPLELIAEVADLAGLDAERVRLWLIARCVQETLWGPPPWRDYQEVLRRLDP